MDGAKSEVAVDKEQPGNLAQETEIKTESTPEHKGHSSGGEKKVKCCGRHHKACKKAKSKKSKKEESESESSSTSESSSSESEEEAEESESESSSSEDERVVRRRKKTKKQKQKKSKRRSRRDPSSDEDENSSAVESSEEEDIRHKKRSKKSRKPRRAPSESDESGAATDDSDGQVRALQLENLRLQRQISRGNIRIKSKKVKKHGKKGSSKPQYFRGDELWDREIHDYRLTPTSERVEEDDYGEYIFHVRRRFDWEGKYTDVRSSSVEKDIKC